MAGTLLEAHRVLTVLLKEVYPPQEYGMGSPVHVSYELSMQANTGGPVVVRSLHTVIINMNVMAILGFP